MLTFVVLYTLAALLGVFLVEQVIKFVKEWAGSDDGTNSK